jgi:hypothetical protein
MKTFARILRIVALGAGLAAGTPSKADTIHHQVYHTAQAAGDAFSILDVHQNNVLRAEELNNGATPIAMRDIDMNNDGFVDRSEFYSYYHVADNGYNDRYYNYRNLNTIKPAAGETTVIVRRPSLITSSVEPESCQLPY